jgi:hypothetical protein
MSIGRVDIIMQKVLQSVPDGQKRKTTRFDILNEMNAVQSELCQMYLALKGEEKITLSTGKTDYPLSVNSFRIKEIIEPAEMTYPLEFTHESEQWKEWVRDTSIQAETQPLKATIWNHVFKITPAPAADLAGKSIQLWCYLLPVIIMEPGIDPEVDSKWDDCIEWETIFRLTKDKKYRIMYLNKANELSIKELKEATKGVLRHRHSSDDLGF